jgi:hypothetical protein
VLMIRDHGLPGTDRISAIPLAHGQVEREPRLLDLTTRWRCRRRVRPSWSRRGSSDSWVITVLFVQHDLVHLLGFVVP